MMTNNINKGIRFWYLQGLIFFFLLAGCAESEKNIPTVYLIMEKDKATGVLVSKEFLTDVPKDSAEKWITMHLVTPGGNPPAMLGNFVHTEQGVRFNPLIPLTPGLEYEVRLKGEFLSRVQVPFLDAVNKLPEVVNVYPTTDTLPENLLKFYVEFSEPMAEGNAMEHIRLVRNGRDTLTDVFMDMQPELWNKEGNILTVWFDPGRIKRDLQPNLRLGPPLQKAAKYKILILPGWQDHESLVTQNVYEKEFVTVSRDSLSPDPSLWTIEIPKPGSDQPVEVILHEPLDYLLLKNAIHITDEKGNYIEGIITVKEGERSFDFIPALPWKAGNYILEVQSRLEDLAGNNLNHPFDNDLTQTQRKTTDVYKRAFRIQ
jgi:hypothetical protein